MPVASFPVAESDRCVKCGLCLPHCPTYLESGHEGDSPRGRIALLQALATQNLDLTAAMERHLDACLGCRRCESVCPAQVPYGHLLDTGRALMLQQKPQRSRWTRLIARVLYFKPLRNTVLVMLWVLQRSGVLALLRQSRCFRASRYGRLASLLPPLVWPWAGSRTAVRSGASPAARPTVAPAPATAAPRGRVQLFTGCLGAAAEREVIVAWQVLLRAAGYAVHIPAGQHCCGALSLHAGEPAPAQQALRRNATVFAAAVPVVALASGCAAGWRDAALAEAAAVPPLVDGFALLRAAGLSWAAGSALRVAVHWPCTQSFAGEQAAMRALLRQIPNVECVELASTRACCGAAGSHFITAPAAADHLLLALLDTAAAARPDVLLSANVGCRLHIQAGLQRRGLAVPVIHPAVFLAQRLQTTPREAAPDTGALR